jgi:hypothetical protein
MLRHKASTYSGVIFVASLDWLLETTPDYKTFLIGLPKVKLCNVGIAHKAPDAGIGVRTWVLTCDMLL